VEILQKNAPQKQINVFVGRESSRGATHFGAYAPSSFSIIQKFLKSVAQSTTLSIGAFSP